MAPHISCKCRYKGRWYRFATNRTAAELSLDELYFVIRRLIGGGGLGDTVISLDGRLTYIDEEGDEIEIPNELAWSHALDIAGAKGLLKIIIHDNNDDKKTNSGEPERKTETATGASKPSPGPGTTSRTLQLSPDDLAAFLPKESVSPAPSAPAAAPLSPPEPSQPTLPQQPSVVQPAPPTAPVAPIVPAMYSQGLPQQYAAHNPGYNYAQQRPPPPQQVYGQPAWHEPPAQQDPPAGYYQTGAAAPPPQQPYPYQQHYAYGTARPPQRR